MAEDESTEDDAVEPASLDLFDRIAAKWDESESDPFAHAEGGTEFQHPTTVPGSEGEAQGEDDELIPAVDDTVIGQLTGEAIFSDSALDAFEKDIPDPNTTPDDAAVAVALV